MIHDKQPTLRTVCGGHLLDAQAGWTDVRGPEPLIVAWGSWAADGVNAAGAVWAPVVLHGRLATCSTPYKHHRGILSGAKIGC